MRRLVSPLDGIRSPFGPRIGGFSPAALFASGEQGAWYDSSDFSTMFQDSAGTTPVTAVEQPVGLIQDKSGNGNHASRSTSASRPVLRARYNLLTYSEQFDNAAWTKTTASVSANAVASPDGTTTADKLIDTTDNAKHEAAQTPTFVSGANYTFSVALKAAELTYVVLHIRDASTGRYAVMFNLSTGTVTDTNTSGAPTGTANSVTDLGGGWYRCSVTVLAAASAGSAVAIQTSNSATGTWSSANHSYIGDGTSGIYLWGADLRVSNEGSANPAYQRIAAATDYDTVGFPPYLFFDGTDDSLATAAIDFSATDEMTVFAGVRKLSDAVGGMVAELSVQTNANAGSFGLSAPNTPAATTYTIRAGGSESPAGLSATPYSAPITNVVSSLVDISADSRIIRVDGAEAATSSSDMGTGNFGAAYPLYIGSRAGTGTRFNGRLYSLIVRGKTSTADEITAAEGWVAGKTGVSL